MSFFPKVKSFLLQDGVFVLNNTVSVSGEADPARIFSRWIQDDTMIAVGSEKENASITFEISELSSDNSEAYEISITKTKITVKASQQRGLIRGASGAASVKP